VYGPRWDVLLQNRAYVAVFGDIAGVPVARGNIVRQMFLDPSRRTLFPDWEDVARTLLQNVRARAASHAGDPAFVELVAGLRDESAEFRTWWDEHDVVRRTIGKKRVEHPIVGELILDHVAFSLPDHADIIVVAYTAVPGSENEERLRRFCTA
jgi:hypothetical protein